MKTKTLLLSLFIAGLFVSHCLEGMEKKSLSDVPDDCILEVLRFLDKEKTFLNFGLTSKGNRELVNKFWTNKSYCGNRGVKIKYNKKTKESFLKFCKEHPDWPYSIQLTWDSTASNINAVLELCGNVRELNRCFRITGWDNIQWPQSLEVLNLGYTSITSDGLNKILKVCTKLKVLNLRSCKQITKEDVAKLRSKYKGCNIIF